MRGTKITLSTRQGRRITGELASFLTSEMREQARVDANAWIKSFRHAPYDGVPMRQRFTYRDESLWWFTEIYLHKMRHLDEAASVLMALEQACDAESPVGLAVHTDSAVVRDTSIAFAERRGLPLETVGSQDDDDGLGWRSYQIGVTAELSRLRGSMRVEKKPAVAAFVHTAFWRSSPGTERPHAGKLHRRGARCGVRGRAVTTICFASVSGRGGISRRADGGTRSASRFRTRAWSRRSSAWRRAPRCPAASRSGGSAASLADAVIAGDGIRAAAVYPRVRPLADRPPRTSGRGDAAVAVVGARHGRGRRGARRVVARVGVDLCGGRRLGPRTHARSRRRNIPSVGLQHGFIYRHWLNYLHEPDEISPAGSERGCPIPDVTLLFDRYAEQHLREAGHFPSSSLSVTGNARLDQLVAQCGALKPMRDALRREFCSTADQPLAVLAAKFNEIQGVLGDLADAVHALPGMRLIIKPHPAETAGRVRGGDGGDAEHIDRRRGDRPRAAAHRRGPASSR